MLQLGRAAQEMPTGRQKCPTALAGKTGAARKKGVEAVAIHG